jgi:predicted acyltransferase
VQVAVVGLLLAATYFAYARYPNAGIDLEHGNEAVGVSAAWAQEHLVGIDPAWHKNANIGHATDVVLLNKFPRTEPFVFNRGGYQTINFIPSLATMLIGLICGELLRNQWRGSRKVLTLVALGAVGLIGGLVWQQLGCPIVKRIWTPSWALFSAGWCCLILAALYGIIDVAGWRRWSFFLVVVGMNSIAAYMMGQLLRGWTAGRLKVHFGQSIFDKLGEDYAPLLTNTAVGLVFWLVCLWMLRQRIFIRV